MKRGRNRGGALEIHKISPTNDINILGSSENGIGFDGEGESVALRLGSGEIEVEKVVISGVVDGEEKATNPIRIPTGSGN